MSFKSEVMDLFPHNVNPENLVFQFRDGKLNVTIELALLHGIYTGIVSVALWNIFINKSQPIGRAMVAIIILLYVATTIDFSINWAYHRYVIIKDDVSESGDGGIVFPDPDWRMETSDIGIGITAVMSTVIADSIMIWRCWMIWGRRWLIVLFPILCLISGFVCKILEIITGFTFVDEAMHFLVVYLSCILATTLWCTVLIVLRIVSVIRANNGADRRHGDYRHVIEVLVESSALHSVTLIIYVALEASNSAASGYFDTLAAITTGVAPTLLAGRIAAGSTRPDDSWEGGIISSLRFKVHPRADAETYSQVSFMSDDDLEAQSSQLDEHDEIGAGKRM